MAGNPDSPSTKRRSWAGGLFGISGDRGALSPPAPQAAPLGANLKVYDTEELGGFTPNSAVPMQASLSASSHNLTSSDFSMSPHQYYETSMSSPNSSHGFSSGTTPGYDQELPFDTYMTEEDFIDHEGVVRNTQTQITPVAANNNNAFFPSPAMTNASIAQNQANKGDGTQTTQIAAGGSGDVTFSNHGSPLPSISSPNITVDDHDATQSSRRTRKRDGDEEAILNRVLPVGRTTAATDDEIPSLRDQELKQIEDENKMKVFRWLSGEGGGSGNATGGGLEAPKSGRIRSRSVGALDKNPAIPPLDTTNLGTNLGTPFRFEHLDSTVDYQVNDGTPRAVGDVLFDDSDEESTDGHTSDEEGLPDFPDTDLGFGHLDDDDIVPPRHVDSIQRMTEEEERALVNSESPHPRQFYRPAPWHDQPKAYSTLHVREGIARGQPHTANAAIERWKRANENIETASRVATFGTIRSRRYSIGEMDGLFKRMSFGIGEENLNVVQRPSVQQARKPSLFEVKNVLKRFSSAGHEHKDAALHALQNFSGRNDKKSGEPSRKDSKGSKIGRERSPSRLSSLTRKLSKKRKQTDQEGTKDTGSAFASIAGVGMSIGGGGTSEIATSAAASINPLSPQNRRHGSLKNNVQFGVPGFTSPTTARHQSQGSLSVPPFEHEASEDEADAPSEPAPAPAPPQLKIPMDKITPNRSGFAKHCVGLNPQLNPKLVDRIAIEQVKRFRKLQENFIKHHNAISTAGKCTNGALCGAVAKDNNAPVHVDSPNNNAAYAAMQDYDSEDDDGVPSTDGRVTATQFPPGVPMPPVNRLPAEFECTLCHKVKKFTKPSDWTKHVHEDVQPFTCTFPECTEPKSFKRKADWVRHENEKHRHLEWWTCNLPDCSHKCYRKDNFVQHLVREHKMPEVKVKAGKGASAGSKSGGTRGSKKGKGEDDDANKLWDIVAACYHETTNKPTSEQCRFCGCRLQSWKKLTVHLARHMEAISLPVITLIGEDAVLSPASTRRGNSTTVTPITPFNPTAFPNPLTGQPGSSSIISPVVSGMQGMYVAAGGPGGAQYYTSPTRPTAQPIYPTPHVTPNRNGAHAGGVDGRVGGVTYANSMDPLNAALHHAQFNNMQPITNDLDSFMVQLQQSQQQQQHQQQQQQVHHQQSYNLPGGGAGLGFGYDVVGYPNPAMVGHVAPGLAGMGAPAGAYGGWSHQQPTGAPDDETERYMNWPSQSHHQPY